MKLRTKYAGTDSIWTRPPHIIAAGLILAFIGALYWSFVFGFALILGTCLLGWAMIKSMGKGHG